MKNFNVKNLVYVLFIFSLSMRPLFSIYGLSIPPSYLLAPIVILFLSYDLKLKRKHVPYVAIISLFLFFQVISVFWSYDQQASIKYSFHVPFLLLVVLVTFSIFRDKDRENNILSVVTYFVCVANFIMLLIHLYTALSMLGAEGEVVYCSLIEKGIHRYLGVNSDPNFQAFYLAFFIGVCFFIDVKFKFLIVSVLASSLLATLSRSGAAALIVSFLIWAILNRKVVLFFVVSLMPIGIYLLLSESLYIQKRMTGLETGAGRLNLWQEAMVIFYESPLLGHGFGTYMSLLRDRGLGGHFAHNTFLEIMVSSGLFGMAFFILYIFSLAYLFLKRGVYSDGIIFLLICFLGMSATLSSFINPFYYFCMAALICFFTSRISDLKRGSL